MSVEQDFCTDRTTDAERCIGERFLSIKSLINKACLYFYEIVPSARTVTLTPWWSNGPGIWSVPGTVGSVTDTATQYTSALETYVEYFASMYAYARGGVRFYMPSTRSGSVNVTVRTLGASDYIAPPVAASNMVANWSFPSANNPVSVMLPQLAPHTSRLVWPYGNLPAEPTYAVIFGFNGGSAAPIYMSATDDTQFGYYMGPPPCALPSLGLSVSALDVAFGGNFNLL